MADSDSEDHVRNSQHENSEQTVVTALHEARRKSRVAGTLFLGGVGVVSLAAGFGYALGLAKKKDPNMFSTGFVGSRTIPESGGALAMRALGYGTLWAIGGVGLLCFGVWKLTGSKSMDEFSATIQSKMPELPKSKEPGKSDFKTVRELINYIIAEDERKKSEKGS